MDHKNCCSDGLPKIACYIFGYIFQATKKRKTEGGTSEVDDMKVRFVTLNTKFVLPLRLSYIEFLITFQTGKGIQGTNFQI